MPKITDEPVYVGCELFVRQGENILLGLRKNCFGAGTWALPGGHLEFAERLVDAACREALEELGAHIKPEQLKMVSIVDGIPPSAGQEHHVHVSFEIKEPLWEPKNMEPELCEEWRYFPINGLPQNMFPPHQPILQNYLTDQFYQY